MKRKKAIVTAVVVVLVIGAGIAAWLRFREGKEVGVIRVSGNTEVTADTFPGKKYAGRVSFIAPQAEFTPKNVQTRKERVKLVYRIKVDVSNPDMELKPGMPADAAIRTEERSEVRNGRYTN